MSDQNSIRGQYVEHGVREYYQQHGATYRNPHEKAVREALREAVSRWNIPSKHTILDLACGSGEVTILLRELGFGQIHGIDPYTGDAYLARTGQEAEALTFEQIEFGALEGRRYDVIVCSFALHLARESRLPVLAYQLAQISSQLLLLTPHKRPELKPEWGWSLADEFALNRVRARLHKSDKKEL